MRPMISKQQNAEHTMESGQVYSRKHKGQTSSGDGGPNKRPKKGKAVEDPPADHTGGGNDENPIQVDTEQTDELIDLCYRCSPKKIGERYVEAEPRADSCGL